MPSGPPDPPLAEGEDFPVSWVEDAFLSRREFTRALGLLSGAAFAATGALAVIRWVQRRGHEDPPPRKVAEVDQVPPHGALVFFYPGPDDPCLLVRGADQYRAFAQRCTHLGCPVIHRPRDESLYCPCHRGFFSAEDGRPLAGPPRRALPRIELETRGGEIWATGIHL